MTANIRTLTKEMREVPMKRFLVPTTALAPMKKMAFTILCVALLMLVAAPAWADQCTAPTVGGVGIGTVTGTNPPHPVTGCGALITVFAVDNGGNATAFTVTTVSGTGNPYDGVEDTFVGVQNSSGAGAPNLTSIALSSSTLGTPFGFDGDGPCNTTYHAQPYSWCTPTYSDPNGYEGPDNTFAITDAMHGTVNFPVPIPNGGSTWFALEGSPLSFGTISQTQTLEPGVQMTYPAGQDNSKWTSGPTSAGGEQLTVTAVPFPQASFTPPAGFPGESCVPYKDFSDASQVNTCVGFETSCVGSDCATMPYLVETNYDLPTDLNVVGAIGGPDFLVYHGQPCPPPVGSIAQSIFLDYTVSRHDPKTGGGGTGISCYVATYTPGAPLITGTGVTGVSKSQFVGFQSPVSDTDVNIITAGSVVPLKGQVSDASGGGITPLTYCPNATGAGCTGNWINLSLFSINCVLDDTPVAVDPNVTTNSGFKDLGGGNFLYNWKTVKGTKGCVNIRVTTSFGLQLVPAQLGFKYK